MDEGEGEGKGKVWKGSWVSPCPGVRYRRNVSRKWDRIISSSSLCKGPQATSMARAAAYVATASGCAPRAANTRKKHFTTACAMTRATRGA